MTAKKEIIDWLRDAYAMERGLEVTLKRISESDDHSALIRSGAARHLEETRAHAAVVESLLKSLGSDVSNVKAGLGMAAETVKGVGTRMARDEQVKDVLASYAMEHFEIACYTALAAGADTAGLPEISDACWRIIAQEQAMAKSLFDALPGVVGQYVSQAEAA
jgi:ferritin-like metal-binding protein YciE